MAQTGSAYSSPLRLLWHAFAVGSPQMHEVLELTRRFETTLIVGFNELRGDDLYNTALVAHRGELLGTYSKCTAYMRFHKQRYPDLDGAPMHDPVCVAHLIDPTLMDVRDAFIEVDCSTGPSWGRTNVDWRGREHSPPPNAKVGLDIDGDRFAELIVERISTLG